MRLTKVAILILTLAWLAALPRAAALQGGEVTQVTFSPASPVAPGTTVTVTVAATRTCGAIEISFGDGAVQTFTILTPLPLKRTHTYLNRGMFTVIARGGTVRGGDNCGGSVSRVLQVVDPPPPPPPNLPPEQLPVYGGSGGTDFARSCGTLKVLTGLRGRMVNILGKSLVGAVGLLCSPVGNNNALGSEVAVGTMAGGDDGTPATLSCGPGRIVKNATIESGSFVDNIRIDCFSWNPETRAAGNNGLLASYSFPHDIFTLGAARNDNFCTPYLRPMNGIRGRAGTVVDAIGFICDEP